MKRNLLCAAFLSVSAALCACSAPMIGTEAPKLDLPFTAEAEITYGSEACRAQIKRFSEESWELCVTEPFALEGLIVTLKDGLTTLNLYGLEGFADFSEEAVSTAKLITDALDAARDGTLSQSGGVTTVTGDSENAHYTLMLDEAGNPHEMTLSGRGISVTLTGFVALPTEEQRGGEEPDEALRDEEQPFVSVES